MKEAINQLKKQMGYTGIVSRGPSVTEAQWAKFTPAQRQKLLNGVAFRIQELQNERRRKKA